MGYMNCDAAVSGAMFSRLWPGRWARAAARAAVVAALALPSLASAQASADLVANNHGPTTAAAGEAFTYTVTLTNNGPWAADGATFTTTMPQNATNVGAVCAASTPGAGCPAALTVSNTAVSGTIPRLPDQGKVVITITGHYGVPSPTSVTSTATVTPPAGVTEVEPATNHSTVNTTLINDAKLIATKTRTGDGDAVTYTITLKNEGNAAAHGARIRDFLEASVHLADAPTQASVNASFVSCTASVGALCPDDAQFGGFTGIKGNGSRTLFDTVIPQLSAGSSVTVVYKAAITPAATCGLSSADLVNTAEITPPDGITNQVGTPRASARLSMPGTAACPPTPTWPFELSKTHDLVGDMLNWNQELIYTVTIVNKSDQAADNTRLYDWLSSSSSSSWVAAADVTSELLDCTAENGARCPADSAFVKLNKQRLGDSKTLFDIRIPVFPPNGKITIRYKVRLDQATQPCGKSWSYLNNFVRAEPPLAGHNSTRLGPSRVKTPGTDACRYASTELLKTESKSIVQMADGSQRQAIDFKVSVKGLGPEPADGAAWTDYLSAGTDFAADLKARGVFVSCAATDGAECPSRDRFIEWEEPVQLNAIRSLFKTGTTIPKLPVGGRIELIYRLILEPLEAGNCKSASAYIENNTRVWAPAPWAGESFKYSRAHLACADLGVSLSVDPIELHAGEELTYTIVVSNSGLSAVNGAVLEDKLPAIFEFESASCEVIKESVPAYPATACGDLIAYDAATHTLRSTIKTIGMLGEVRFRIKGRAGKVPGTYKNEARVTMPSGVVDPRLVSNFTDVNVQIANTRSPLTVKKVVAGLPAAGLPEALTFTGEVSCGIQPPQPWSITVPAGALEASLDPALSFYDGEQCTVSENTPPAPPAGYAWDGAPSIGNSADPLGPSTAREVTVVNPLQRLSAVVELSKRFSGPAEVVEKVNGTFSFELDCGADGQYQQDVVVAGGAAASVTVSGLPAGASCRVREAATPAAPAGYEWGTPEYSADPVRIPVEAGGTVDLAVTNPLKSSAVPPPTPVPTLGLPLLAVLAGLLGGLGALYRRRQSASAG